MAKRSKSKARKKALKLAEKPSNTPTTAVIANEPKKVPNTPKTASDTVIIDDHLKIKPKSSLTSTKTKTPPNDPFAETFTDKSVAVLRVAAVVLVVLIVVLMVCLWFFYGRAHKASFYNSSSLVLIN